ncbi:MAG: alpha/beta hydrolase [Candidatus Acidiferrales bacterium]
MLALLLTAGAARAQVPPKIEAQLQKMGHIVDPGCTAVLYRPMMPKKDIVYQLEEMKKTGKPSYEVPIYPGITIYRDMSFGPDPKNVVDIFTADKGPSSRPVLIYVPGGVGNKIELQNRAANAFNDNIARWAVQHGMVAVLMQRRGSASGARPDYYAGAKDVAAMIQYAEANISQYHGDPNRMFAWAQSAGNGPLGIYAGHPELYGPQGVGLVGIIFMSGQFDILRPDGTDPVSAAAAGGFGGSANLFAQAGKTCGLKGGAFSTEGVLPGRSPDQPGGQAPFVMSRGGLRFGGSQVPLKVQIEESSLPGLEKTRAKILLASAELDPGVTNQKPSPFNQALHDELCKLAGPHAVNGKGHCPVLLYEKGESHMSEIFSVDTADHTVSGPILAWIKSVNASLDQKRQN